MSTRLATTTVQRVTVATAAATDLPDRDDWLTVGERVTLSGFRFEKRRTDWRLGRWVGKRAVIEHGSSDRSIPGSTAIEIRAAPDGAPEAWIEAERASLVLSLSHSQARGFAVVSDGGLLGCDCERVESRSPAFVRDYFTTAERDAVAMAIDDEAAARCTLIWSAKESALKALREGLRADTRSVEVDVGGWGALGSVRQGGCRDWRSLRVYASSGIALVGVYRFDQSHVWTVLADRALELEEEAVPARRWEISEEHHAHGRSSGGARGAYG